MTHRKDYLSHLKNILHNEIERIIYQSGDTTFNSERSDMYKEKYATNLLIGGPSEASDTTSEVPALKHPDPRAKIGLSYFLSSDLQKLLEIMSQGLENITDGNIKYLQKKLQGVNQNLREKLHIENSNYFNINKPTYFFIDALLKANLNCMIPGEEDKCLAIAATANSGNPAAPYSAMQFISNNFCKENWTLWGVAHGTSQEDCITGVSRVHPNQWCVLYQENTSKKDFVKMTKRMKNQMCNEIGKKSFKYMFMHGCTHYQILKNVEGTSDVSWSATEHETWLNCLQLAEMATAVEKLPVGGHLCIKIRIMKQVSTHHPLAVVATMFEKCEIVAVPGQICQFALVMFCSKKFMNNDHIQSLSKSLCESAEGTLKPLMKWSFNHGNLVSFDVLERCTAVADEMTEYDDITFEVFAAVVREIERQPDITWDKIKKENSKVYNLFENRFKDKEKWFQTFDKLKEQIFALQEIDKRLLEKMFKDF